MTDEISTPEEIEDDEQVLDVDPDQEVMPVTYEITSYGADYPVDGLIRRLNDGDIAVPSFDPEYADNGDVRGFQRRFVWSRPQMDKFVESLLLGLPVPGIFLVREKSNRLLVLDGQQRLRTLQTFYSGLYAGREYRLKHVQASFKEKKYQDLDPEDRRRLDDSIIHATVLRQDHPAGSQDAVYSIFERLNTGGSPLQPQEIRVALFNGSFMHLINSLNDDPNWRMLYGPKSSRFKDQELVLRVLALYESADKYARPVKGFLNHYLASHQDRSLDESVELVRLFRESAASIATHIGPRAFRPVRPLNAAVLDSLSVAVMRRLSHGAIDDGPAVGAAYEELLADPKYQAATTSSTAAEDAVKERLSIATDAFADIA